jgi:hypothetical protein
MADPEKRLIVQPVTSRRPTQTGADGKKIGGTLGCMGNVSVNMSKLIFPETLPPHLQWRCIVAADALPSAPRRRKTKNYQGLKTTGPPKADMCVTDEVRRADGLVLSAVVRVRLPR